MHVLPLSTRFFYCCCSQPRVRIITHRSKLPTKKKWETQKKIKSSLHDKWKYVKFFHQICQISCAPLPPHSTRQTNCCVCHKFFHHTYIKFLTLDYICTILDRHNTSSLAGLLIRATYCMRPICCRIFFLYFTYIRMCYIEEEEINSNLDTFSSLLFIFHIPFRRKNTLSILLYTCV